MDGSKIIVSLTEEGRGSKGNVLGTASVKTNLIYNNMDYFFWLGNIKVKPGKTYYINITSNKKFSGVHVWSSIEDAYAGGTHYYLNSKSDNDLVFQTYNLKSLNQIFNEVISKRKGGKVFQTALAFNGLDSWNEKDFFSLIKYLSIPFLLVALIISFLSYLWIFFDDE